MKLVASKWYSGGAVVLPVTVYFFNYFSTLSAWAQSSIALYSPEPRRLQKRGTSCVLPHPEVAPPTRIVVDKGIVKQHWVKAWVETEMNSSLAFSKDTPHSRLSSIRKWKADELKQPRLAEQYRLHETRELNICQTACKPTANSTHHQASSCRCAVDIRLHQRRNILSRNTPVPYRHAVLSIAAYPGRLFNSRNSYCHECTTLLYLPPRRLFSIMLVCLSD